VMNSAYQQVMLWNGQFGATGPNAGTEHLWKPGTPLEMNFLGYEGVETQAIAGMTVHRLDIVHDFVYGCEYREMFDAAFPEVPEIKRYTKITAGLAMAAYGRTVLSNRAPFQDYLKGDYYAMTEDQKQGALLFFGKANCVACHTGPALNSMEFHALGMMDLMGEDFLGPAPDVRTQKGRGGFTGNPDDDYKFKVPQLYGLRAARHFGHGASFYDLHAVVEYKNIAIKENPRVPDSQLAEEFVPLNLTKSEIKQLVTFIEDALNDKELYRYAPESLPSGLCFPNNDEQSRIDLGCEIPESI
ncbi:MAG: cytochrome-c peroxidase, partial [Bacteroidales bacterium]